MFADDTELYKSDFPSEALILAQTIESCVSDVKVWVVQNKLQLNDDKTEILLIGSAPGIDLPSSLCVGHSDIPFSNAARNLGVIFDIQLATLKEQVNKLCHLAYLEIGRIGSLRHYLFVCFEATKVSFPLLFSPGLITVLLSLLALLRFSLITVLLSLLALLRFSLIQFKK